MSTADSIDRRAGSYVTDAPAVVIERALLSVSDKTGLVDLGRALSARGIEILSTGGSASALREAGLPVIDVSAHTGFPEMMDGRVKTLHPIVHGGILALRDQDTHRQAMDAHGMAPIDLVVVNLYPFEATVAGGADFATCIENIDIGGPAMIRSAAKNHAFVTVVVDPEDYGSLIDALGEGGTTSGALRRRLAAKAYTHTAAYDAAISNWFADQAGDAHPERLVVAADRRETLRYGENPHQSAAFYVNRGAARAGIATAEQLQGKALSYNNLNDTDAAFELAAEFGEPAVAIIKHANPCGVAIGDELARAYQQAFECDSRSAFGGIVATNRVIDLATVEAMEAAAQADVVIAPGYADGVIERLVAKRKNTRLLTATPPAPPSGLELRQIGGGYLVQDAHHFASMPTEWQVVTQRRPTEREMADAAFAWRVCGHVTSNAIVLAKDGVAWGIGAGQQNRVEAGEIAAAKADGRAKDGACASDAFYPFPDGIDAAADAGAAIIVQPGGSVNDDKTIAAADARGVAMVFTGERHFLH